MYQEKRYKYINLHHNCDFTSLFDTYFHFLIYKNKIYLGKPNNKLAYEIIFGWILVQIAFLIYQLRAYKHPIKNEMPKINFEQDRIRREQDRILRREMLDNKKRRKGELN